MAATGINGTNKDLREVIANYSLRQLGNTYAEAMRNLPKVHAEIEALFDTERHTPDSQRAIQVIKEALRRDPRKCLPRRCCRSRVRCYGTSVSWPWPSKVKFPEVVRQIDAAQMEPMTLKTVLEEYEFKAKAGEDNRSLKSRVSRISKTSSRLGKNRFSGHRFRTLLAKTQTPSELDRLHLTLFPCEGCYQHSN